MSLYTQSQQLINNPYKIVFERFNGERLTSTDGGYSWINSNQSKPLIPFRIYYHKSDGKVIQSYDGGYSWHEVPPVIEELEIVFANKENALEGNPFKQRKVNIVICTLLGEILLNEDHYLYDRSQITQLVESQQLSNGIYLLLLVSNNNTILQKIIINK